jgi:hypothetical protein
MWILYQAVLWIQTFWYGSGSCFSLWYRSGSGSCFLNLIRIRSQLFDTDPDPYKFQEVRNSSLCTSLLDFPCQQCCGSGMFIPDPGSGFFPIPDLGSRIPDPKKHGEVKKFFLNLFSHLFVALRYCWNRSWIINVAHLAFFSFFKPRKNWLKALRKVGSGIRKRPIPDPGSRGQKGSGSGSATLLVSRSSRTQPTRLNFPCQLI